MRKDNSDNGFVYINSNSVGDGLDEELDSWGRKALYTKKHPTERRSYIDQEIDEGLKPPGQEYYSGKSRSSGKPKKKGKGNYSLYTPVSPGIYFLRGENTNLTKVGYTDDPERRFSQLKSSNADKLIFEHFIYCKASKLVDVERQIHYLICDLHVRGEWYDLTQEHLTLLRGCKVDSDVFYFVSSKKKFFIQGRREDELSEES